MDIVQKIDVTVNEDDILEGASKVLGHIRPRWPKEKIAFKMLTDGITNKLVKCGVEDEPEEEAVLVRIYGNKTDLLIDRNAETKNIIMLNKVGLAPRLYATFNNGLAYEFVPGCTLTVGTVIQPEVYKLVARRMAKLHQVTVDGQPNPRPVLWKKLDDFLKLVPDKFTDSEKRKRYEEIKFPKHKMKQEIEFLKEKLTALDSPVVFCHNDLLLGNVIHTPSKNCVTFIDFEYATFNYQAYDIGDHFTEFAGVEEIDNSRYPSKKFQMKWLHEYLSSLQDNVTDDDLERLYVQVNQFALTAYLLWGIWALIQAEHSYIDFDFLEFAEIKFNEYSARKAEFLSLELPR